MERRRPDAAHLAALYDLINELMPHADVYYTPEQVEELQGTKGIEIVWE